MEGMTYEQAQQMIKLLKDILSELQQIKREARSR